MMPLRFVLRVFLISVAAELSSGLLELGVGIIVIPAFLIGFL
jgi:hypothetical protein